MNKLLFTCLFLQSCATTYDIESIPGAASVSIGSKQLGETPIQLVVSDLSSLPCFQQGSACLVMLNRNGFKPEWIVVSSETKSFGLEIALQKSSNVKQGISPKIPIANVEQFEESGKEILQLQTLLFDNKLLPNERVESLLSSFPNSATVNFLSSMSLFQKGQKTEALAFMEKAIELAPSDVDYKVILEQMKKRI